MVSPISYHWAAIAKNVKCTERSQNEIEHYRAKYTPCKLNYYPQTLNFPPFCSTIAHFPDNWCFWFLHRVQWWVLNFQKEFVKNHTVKISKIPNLVSWGPWDENSGQVWKCLAATFHIVKKNGESHWSLTTLPKLRLGQAIGYVNHSIPFSLLPLYTCTHAPVNPIPPDCLSPSWPHIDIKPALQVSHLCYFIQKLTPRKRYFSNFLTVA